MAYKDLQLEEVGRVRLYKRKGTHSIKISVNPTGDVRVSLPSWAAYSMGVTFVRSQRQWIVDQKAKHDNFLTNGQHIGKAHSLYFQSRAGISEPTSRTNGNEIVVYYPMDWQPEYKAVQRKATEASVKALRYQAEELLPQRLRTLAEENDFYYKSISVKRLKSRWGSCDQSKNITLNLFLMQLPWELIDYVLLHELVHTRVLQHGTPFWSEMKKINPLTPQLRQKMKNYSPALATQAIVPMP
jgi:predicted metal-dependent hydrolase